jgi:hypothetical protein
MSELPLIVKRELKAIPEQDWHKLTSEAAAIKYACDRSGLQDKSICIEVGIDAATLSRAKAGQIKLPDDKRAAFMDVTGCEAPLYADVLMRGYDPRSLRKLETETERECREAREALQREREKTALLTELLQGKSS